MSGHVERAAEWVYHGVWGVLARWFRVPKGPPTMPTHAGEEVRSFHPSDGFLRYLKVQFWIGLFVIDVIIVVAWVALLIAVPVLGIVLAPVALVVAVVPDLVAYVALHLRYDTTWYVVSDRSLRIRRGIWIIHEMTITFENIQNVLLAQGPLERYFGYANVVVDTAGGGGGTQQQQQIISMHRGVIEGVENAAEIRDLIRARVQQSESAGLGDEEETAPVPTSGWGPEHVAALRDVRDAVALLVKP